MLKNSWTFIFFFLICCPLVQAQENTLTATLWQDAPQSECFTAQYNAPLGTILEVKHYTQTIFVEIIKENSNPQDKTLYLSPCVWNKLTQSENSLSLPKILKVSIQQASQAQQGLAVSSPALTAPKLNNTYENQSTGFEELQGNTNLGFQGLQGNNTNLGFQGLQGNNTNASNTNLSSTNTNYGNTITNPSYTNNTNNLQKVTEKGYASLSNIPNSKPFAVLHRTAPIGTLINIKNPINGSICAAEVIAKINPVTAKAGVILEVSQAVFMRLGAAKGELVNVEISYMAAASTTEIVQLTSLESIYLSNEPIALHPTLPVGTRLYVQEAGSFIVMGKSSQANTLLIPSLLYKNLPAYLPKDKVSISYTLAQNLEERIRNFEPLANVIDEGVATLYPSAHTETLAVWHKEIPVGSTLLVEHLCYQDTQRTLWSRHFLKVVGKLAAHHQEDMQLSTDAWQLLQKPTLSYYSNQPSNNNPFANSQNLNTNNAEVLVSTPDNPAQMAVFIYYFAP